MNLFLPDEDELRKREEVFAAFMTWAMRHPFDLLMAMGAALYLLWRLW
jgi:hypothetical protein